VMEERTEGRAKYEEFLIRGLKPRCGAYRSAREEREPGGKGTKDELTIDGRSKNFKRAALSESSAGLSVHDHPRGKGKQQDLTEAKAGGKFTHIFSI